MTIYNIILQAQKGGIEQTLLMLGLMVIVFYFFMIRPQQKKMKLQKSFLEGLQKGDKVVTTGGIHGKVLNFDNTTLTIESEGSRFKVEKSFISAEMSQAANKAATTATTETK